jgi:anti-sigma regulatory factor (Ser/Thr protein kinase)
MWPEGNGVVNWSIPSLDLVIDEMSQAAEARRRISELARRLGFDETSAGRVAIVVSEIATNLVKHAGEGRVIASRLEQDGCVGIEVLALDTGPGIADLRRSLTDGFSTSGSSGTGLGAIRRLSSSFDVYSLPETGSVLVSRLWRGRPGDEPRPAWLEVGAVNLPKPGEELSGDGWAFLRNGSTCTIMVSDGLGHGIMAHEASDAALQVFNSHGLEPTEDVLQAMHVALHGTRGAAVGIARLDLDRRMVDFSGVGNVAGTIVTRESSRNTVSLNGIIGHSVRQFRKFEYAWPEGALLVLHSDGLGTRWRMESYPGLISRHPSVIAGVLWRDHRRGNDDSTVVVARETR